MLLPALRPSRSRFLAPGIVLSIAAVSFAAGMTAAVAMVGRAPAPPAIQAPALAPPVAEIQWATTVREFSSQFGTNDWAANRVLGAPDVWPRSGDEVDAWASRDADSQIEFIEVGFDHPRRLSALEIYETFNPGAIVHVELLTESGGRLDVYEARAEPMGGGANKRVIDFGCTEARIVGARVVLDSTAVGGWNELDAIGAVACAQRGP
jgi:hypothetical protein